MHVLVVEDDTRLRQVLVRLLRVGGFDRVEEASDGAQALERYVLNHHDLVVLDMVMHGMYGLEVLAKLRELNPKLPVIIVTADIQKSTREQVQGAGAAAIVNKPVKKDELASVVATVLSGGAAWS